MSQLEIKGLENNFDGWRRDRAPDAATGTAFERYAIELILKDADLSDEDISSGLFGGGDDGGIDGVYFFVNRQLMSEEDKVPENVIDVRLWVIQAKYETGFGETPVEKIQMFMADLLNFEKPVTILTYYNQQIRDFISLFRDKYEKIIGQPHSLNFSFVYATKSDQEPHPKVIKRVDNLRDLVRSLISSAGFDFQFWGARSLTEAFRTPPNRTLALEITKQFMSDDGSVVCLTRLDKFAAFLTDENGRMRQYLLEPNVRDYQGERNPVNSEIRKSLESPDLKEFWWLNNGITILADKCSVAASKVEMVSPELVNGLQTSYELFNHFSGKKLTDGRSVLVRVILPPNEAMRRRIVKATNNQTQVSQLSLRATDDIHFDIEELFKLYNVYYDRRKGEYRRRQKPVSQIVSMKDVAQAVLACLLQQPDDARARPMSQLSTDEAYLRIFSPKADRELFLVCVLLDRQVQAYLSSRDDLSRDERNDLRYYVDTNLAATLAKKAKPSAQDIAALGPVAKVPIESPVMAAACEDVIKIYKNEGGNANAAKGAQMRAALINALQAKFG